MSIELMLLVDNSNVLELRGLRNALSEEYVSDALVVATLENTKGQVIVDAAILTSTDEPGCYRSLLVPAQPIIKEQRYKLTLNAQGAGLTAHWETYVQAKTRRT
ncbi:hypothetical protein [Methylophaga sp.]|uniref:hypothetical protein n=1 Tax=Methylophaga sp. TaxID=2024840 RepID=UPI0025F672BB|nr:hypothetical protein [Methylophaga sp.]